VLVAAQEWGCPPWEIAGGGKMTWFYRYLEYRMQMQKAREYREKK